MDYGLEESQSNFNLASLESFNYEYWLWLAFWVVFVVGLVFILRSIIRTVVKNNRYYNHVVFLIRLPKEKPKDSQEGSPMNRIQQMHDEIAKGESIFAAIGGMRAQRGFTSIAGWRAWLLGRTDHFSFEIVANKKIISFYAVAPEDKALYLEQQIHANFPEAMIEQVQDYNIFTPNCGIAVTYLKTLRSFIFPIKTYKKMEVDPMSSLINSLSKLEAGEGVAIQYIVRSAKPDWHRVVVKFVENARRLNSIDKAFRSRSFNKFLSFFNELIITAKPKELKPEDRHVLTPMEEEMLKVIEEKNSKAGLDVNIRLVVAANDEPSANRILGNLVSSFGEYSYYQYGNQIQNKVEKLKSYLLLRWPSRILKDFIFRRFDIKTSFILNVEEMNSLFHPPLKWMETPNILWLTAKLAPAPAVLPDEGIILGTNVYRQVKKDIKIKRADRRRHAYIIGKSGVGKSQLMANMVIQDILNGEGICVLDPHGDLISDVLERIPPERADDVILFSPRDYERPLALNLLEYDSRYPEQKTFVINEMIKIFDKLYDLKATGGPIFEQYMRNAMLLIMSDPDSGSTLMEIPKVLADADFRRMKLDRCSDPTVVEFWRKEAEKAGGDAALANVVPYITSKLTQFISNDTMRPIIGQQRSSFNPRDVMDKRKILLVDLTKGLIGEMNSYLLGMILVGKILIAALSRADMNQADRKDFYLYIDEFQNFTTDSICAILSEARKYNLNLIIAHQYLGQLVKNNDTTIRDAVFGNVGTWMLFKIGSDDAEKMEKEFSPVFNQFDLINVEKYTAYVKLLVDNTASRPFSMSTPWPLMGIQRPEVASKIRVLSRLKYGQDRNIIEAEIRKRATFV